MKSKKRGLSLEEKREKILQIFYESQDFYLVCFFFSLDLCFSLLLNGSFLYQRHNEQLLLVCYIMFDTFCGSDVNVSAGCVNSGSFFLG